MSVHFWSEDTLTNESPKETPKQAQAAQTTAGDL